MTDATAKDLEQDRAIAVLNNQLRALSARLDQVAEAGKRHEDLEGNILAKLAASNELIAEDILKLGKHIVEIKTFMELKRGAQPLSTNLDLHASKK